MVQLEGKLSGFAAGMFRSCLFSEKNGEEKTGASAIRSISRCFLLNQVPNNAFKSAGKWWVQLGPVGSNAEGNGQNSWSDESEMI